MASRISCLWFHASTDITYIRLGRRFIYLAVILDAYTRAVRGWALSRSLEQQLTLDALDMTLAKATPFIFHSDQGAQYAAWLHTDHLLERELGYRSPLAYEADHLC
jgi:putative transposase